MNSGSKMDSSPTGMWVNFFTSAGIPSDVAATYALTFTENRIQPDMLLDLNKEYLRDMGISRMGDVIAILRHAKHVHESTARDRVLSTAVNVKVPVATVTGRSTAAPSSPASRILEHYTRNPQVQDPPTAAVKRKSNDNIGSYDGVDTDANTKKSRLIRFSSPPKSSVKEVTSNKPTNTCNKTVFSRLGNTEPVKAVAKEPVKPIYARLGSKTEKAITKQDFLVSKLDFTPTKLDLIAAKPCFMTNKPTLKSEGLVIPIDKDALKYEGILKSTAPTKKVVTVTTSKNVRKIAIGCTMRADEAPISVKEKLNTKSVKFSSQVQYKEIEANKKLKLVQNCTAVFNKPERRLSMPERQLTMPEKDGVKARLGAKDTNNLTITRNVFNRLGV